MCENFVLGYTDLSYLLHVIGCDMGVLWTRELDVRWVFSGFGIYLLHVIGYEMGVLNLVKMKQSATYGCGLLLL